MPGVGDVLERETAWYLQAVPGLPVLVGDPDGPFHVVASQVRRLTQHRNQLYLGILSSVEGRGSKNGARRIDHEITALVLWGRRQSGARAHVELDALDDALERVVQRVQGTPELPKHDGRWWMVSPTTVEFPAPTTILAFADVIGAADPAHLRSVRYTVTEWR